MVCMWGGYNDYGEDCAVSGNHVLCVSHMVTQLDSTTEHVPDTLYYDRAFVPGWLLCYIAKCFS